MNRMTPNDRAHEPLGHELACPSVEALSCFIDGELHGDRAAAVGTHVSRCPDCGEVLRQMQALGDQGGASAGAAGGGCPERETLVGYLMGSLASDEQRAVDAHVLTCDACVHALASTHHRLRRLVALDAPVPAVIVERALASARPDGERPFSLVRHRRRARASVPVYLRLPVLLPTAFAAGAALFIAVNAANLAPRPRPDQTRGASAFTEDRRVTTADVLVRSDPRDTAAVVARVARGVAVEVQAQEREWLLVSLPTGEHGWVPRRAFE
jgi:anti-sigma factor RsiW